MPAKRIAEPIADIVLLLWLRSDQLKLAPESARTLVAFRHRSSDSCEETQGMF